MKITKLSASAIRDYISCPYKLKYRMLVSGEAVKTPQMILGTIVHRVIENYKMWNTYAEGITLANHYLNEENISLPQEQINNMIEAIHNYNDSFREFSIGAESEYEFSIPLKSCGINIIGRMDILGKDYIVDWKVTGSMPSILHNDPQFILYDWAFEQINKIKPVKIMYVNVLRNEVATYFRNEYYFSNLFDEVIPGIVNGKVFYPRGLYDYVRAEKYRICHKCPFKQVCWSDFYELDS